MVIHLKEERPPLQPLVQRLLGDIRQALAAQPATSTWGAAEHGWALSLLAELGQDWETQGVRVGALQDLGQLSHRLDMVAATVTRANLEALSCHLRWVLDAAALDLEPLDPDSRSRPAPD
ncbi:hypothetical protein E7T06_08605 [Deinococcus sp. Arct2-2]|uniref:hypothetical protein n=1 Tax=Deinococcus sp. Arct2-2 TaxID=2568653 RepID=UPI0010A327A5|nr:hypothetical protein [Deinococcus sp. Arct2-2]THF70235.1 hypothetical protein E7T06_08605 [Deinococcus sp. Arct2-2]